MCLKFRQHPAWREAGRPAGPAADQVRSGDQPQTAKTLGIEVPPSILLRADK
jgi:hypothetical protein